jgi:hypothetical protein
MTTGPGSPTRPGPGPTVAVVPTSPPRPGGILGGPIDDPGGSTRGVRAVPATTGLAVLHRPSRFAGVVLDCTDDEVTLRDPRGTVRRLRNEPGAFAVDGLPVRLVRPPAAPTPPVPAHLADARVTADRTASGSRAVVGARARVARAGRILVEGVHDAVLVEHVWGDDLRIEGVVVERLDGADHLADALRALDPAPGRRVGVLLDHLVPGSKEARIARSVAHPCVLVTGTPYVDVWQAVKPEVVGIAAWPTIPRGTDWKSGVCAALGFADPRALWHHIRASVRDWMDLEQPLVRAVEELIDFVTDDAG